MDERKRQKQTQKTPQDADIIIMELLYNQCLPKRKVVEHFIDNYGLSQSQSYNVINKFFKKVAKLHQADFNKDYSDLVLKYEDLYHKAVLDKQIASARAILNDIMKLKGLSIEKKEIKIDPIEINYIDPTKLDEE